MVLVLLDLTRPHMNGEKACRQLCRIDSHVRVVLSSGHTENGLASRLAGKGLVVFIQKPYLCRTRDRPRAVLDGSGTSCAAAGD